MLQSRAELLYHIASRSCSSGTSAHENKSRFLCSVVKGPPTGPHIWFFAWFCISVGKRSPFAGPEMYEITEGTWSGDPYLSWGVACGFVSSLSPKCVELHRELGVGTPFLLHKEFGVGTSFLMAWCLRFCYFAFPEMCEITEGTWSGDPFSHGLLPVVLCFRFPRNV